MSNGSESRSSESREKVKDNGSESRSSESRQENRNNTYNIVQNNTNIYIGRENSLENIHRQAILSLYKDLAKNKILN